MKIILEAKHMCGISGLVGIPLAKELQETKNRITKMATILSYRGPDGTATIHNQEGTAYFGMNTLLIVNEKGDIGPYWNEAGKVMLTFNGEIYNYRKLAKEWGVKLTGGKSDSHVVLTGYERFGPDFVNHLDGMFAIAIFDDRSKKLHLFRDRMGEKPLYYKSHDGIICFASETKALNGTHQKKITNDFLTYENTLGKNTLYEGVYLLPPGHHLEFDTQRNHIRTHAYWNLSSIGLLSDTQNLDVAATFKGLLDKSIASRTPPHRPFGAMLSGGIDSSLLAVKMKPDYVFTVSYPGMERFDEIERANLVAQQIGAHHVIIRPTPEDFKIYFEKVVYHLDYPIGNSSSFSEYMLYKAAADTGIKVLVGGIGSDEIMMGYARHTLFFAEENSESPLPESYTPLVKTFKARIRSDMLPYEKYYELIRRGPSFPKQKGKIRDLFSAGEDLGQSLSLVDLSVSFPSLLKSSDKLSSAFGLEVRLPFLAHELVEFVYSLPLKYKFQAPDVTKFILREYAKKEGVLNDIINDKDKKGFSTPTGKWLKGELSAWFNEVTKNIHVDQRIAHLTNDHRDRGEYDRSDLQLLSLAFWN